MSITSRISPPPTPVTTARQTTRIPLTVKPDSIATFAPITVKTPKPRASKTLLTASTVFSLFRYESRKIYATINIDKIKLYRPIYKYKSKLNKVDINIELLKESNNPKLKYGNIILASHNGNNKNSYFKHLDKLEKGDIIKIKYNNITYKYKLDNIYEVEKNNKINIKRDMYQNTLTLITCKKNTTNKQEVYISYLI